MEAENHSKHLGVTLSRLFEILGFAGTVPFVRESWLKVADLVVPGITTEKMVLIHLLWFQHIGRIIIKDIDPFSGAVLVSVKLMKERKPEYS